MGKGKVLIGAPVHPVLIEGLKHHGYEVVVKEKIRQETAAHDLKDCVGVITSNRLQLDKELIDAAPLLRWIGRMGSGMEVIDVDYAGSKGILCFNSPEGNSNAVGEHALGMLLSLTKKITVSNNEVKAGLWIREANRGIELEGKTIGLIGYGHTGKAFAKKLAGFDMRILAFDKYDQQGISEPVIHCESLQPIFDQADIVSFHVPLQKDTIHYFNDEFLNNMSNPFMLINTSRGAVVDMEALYKGLQTGKITGVCLDVVEEEPPGNMKVAIKKLFEEILQMQQSVVTPHVAGYSSESLYKMSKLLLNKIVNEM